MKRKKIYLINKYVAMSEASQELLSMFNSIKLIIKDLLPMTLWCDNKAAIISVETKGGNKLRHIIEIKDHHVKECFKRKIIVIKWIKSKEQIADILTKPLSFELHKTLTNKIMNIKI